MKAGATGLVMKKTPLDRLLGAVRTILEGEQYIPPDLALRVRERMPAHLSPRELDVLQMLGRGFSNKEIGAELGVVEGTVKIHVTNIFGKLGVSDRTRALLTAIKRGIVQID